MKLKLSRLIPMHYVALYVSDARKIRATWWSWRKRLFRVTAQYDEGEIFHYRAPRGGEII